MGLTSIDARIYYLAGGVVEPINPNAYTNADTFVRTVNMNDEHGDADVSTRSSRMRKHEPSTRDYSLECEGLADASDTAYTAFHNAYLNRSTLGIIALDDDIDTAGSTGTIGDFKVFNWSINQSDVEGSQTVSFTLRPARTTFEATTYTVTT
jgi:hypothetical protein